MHWYVKIYVWVLCITRKCIDEKYILLIKSGSCTVLWQAALPLEYFFAENKQKNIRFSKNELKKKNDMVGFNSKTVSKFDLSSPFAFLLYSRK